MFLAYFLASGVNAKPAFDDEERTDDRLEHLNHVKTVPLCEAGNERAAIVGIVECISYPHWYPIHPDSNSSPVANVPTKEIARSTRASFQD